MIEFMIPETGIDGEVCIALIFGFKILKAFPTSIEEAWRLFCISCIILPFFFYIIIISFNSFNSGEGSNT